MCLRIIIELHKQYRPQMNKDVSTQNLHQGCSYAATAKENFVLRFPTYPLPEGNLTQCAILHRVRKAQRYICAMQCNKWKQLLPSSVFTHGAAAATVQIMEEISIFHALTHHASCVAGGLSLKKVRKPPIVQFSQPLGPVSDHGVSQVRQGDLQGLAEPSEQDLRAAGADQGEGHLRDQHRHSAQRDLHRHHHHDGQEEPGQPANDSE